MVLAGLGAVVVFVSVLGYVSSVRSQVGGLVTVLKLTSKVQANSPITQDMVAPVEIPRRWMPPTTVTDFSQLDGKVAATDLPKGSYLQKGMVITAPRLQPGQREIAIMVNAETGVAGKVHPGSVVDIYATFPASNRKQPACATRVISRARVLDVGKLRTEHSGQGASVSENKVVPITFALSAEESLTLTYAESFADKVRLARIGGVGRDKPPQPKSVCAVPRKPQGR